MISCIETAPFEDFELRKISFEYRALVKRTSYTIFYKVELFHFQLFSFLMHLYLHP